MRKLVWLVDDAIRIARNPRRVAAHLWDALGAAVDGDPTVGDVKRDVEQLRGEVDALRGVTAAHERRLTTTEGRQFPCRADLDAAFADINERVDQCAAQVGALSSTYDRGAHARINDLGAAVERLQAADRGVAEAARLTHDIEQLQLKVRDLATLPERVESLRREVESLVRSLVPS